MKSHHAALPLRPAVGLLPGHGVFEVSERHGSQKLRNDCAARVHDAYISQMWSRYASHGTAIFKSPESPILLQPASRQVQVFSRALIQHNQVFGRGAHTLIRVAAFVLSLTSLQRDKPSLTR